MADHPGHESMIRAPAHPVAQLQGPFEESMLESIQDDPDADIYLDPVVRRNTLLEAPTYTRVVAGRWKQKPGEKFHPLWKLIAQISFGVHLLAEGMAKSEDEVMQILQAHVDEIDGFLERTTEDFDLAQDDIQERLRCLKLPLSHPATFDKMLEDRNFRLSIVEGNEKIEHIVERTTQAMKDSLKDVQKGFDSTSCLETYLRKLSHAWVRESVEHEAVFVAMLGNVEGWRKAFMSLHMQGGKLGGSLKKLTDIINEMQARAGEVSRRLLHQARGYGVGNDTRTHQNQTMGRPAPGRNTPTSRFQTMPNKQLPIMPERPPLRQAVSNDTVKSHSSMRSTPSQENMGQHNTSRSGTPQNGVPAARQVKTGASPKIIQIGPTSSGRVQSMVPSLLESIPSPKGTPNSTTPPPLSSLTIDEEEQPERYFPPVELPAHVPEETMRQAPMSKQNRLSLGLGLVQANRSDKRVSRLGAPAAALVDLLRKPSSHRSSTLSQTPTSSNSPQISRRPSVNATNAATEAATRSTTQSSSPNLPSVSDSSASTFAKNNIRRPKKGVQHWFDAHDDELNEDDKFSVQEGSTAQVTTVATQGVAKPGIDYDSNPGTPSWAVTSFAQADKRRADLKKGAFNSHPPDLPPGSPPLGQEHKLPNPLSVVAPQRTPSHASSAGTLGEPGPAITPSEAGSIKIRPNLRNEAHDWKRASAAAPEVVVVHSPPPMPLPPKQFVAEMEGSTPVSAASRATTPRTFAMELEAPQQYFKLPPRPQTTIQTTASLIHELKEGGRETEEQVVPHQQYFRLPPRPTAPAKISSLPPASVETSKDLQPQLESAGEAATEAPETARIGDEKKSKPNQDITITASRVDASTDSGAAQGPTISKEIVHDKEESSSNEQYIATPQIPLPPSPLESETPVAAKKKDSPVVLETLFLLPAVAYKAPVSPKLNEEQRETHLEPTTNTSSVTNISETNQPTIESKVSIAPDSGSSTPIVMPPKSLPKLAGPRVVIPGSPAAASRQMQRDHKPANLKHTRNTSSHGSQNGWKAFFTGQPSPVGSNLSIRSIRRESAMEQSSPTLLSPGSASGRFPPSPGATSAKDIVWFNKPFEELKPASKVSSNSPSEKGKTADGLGIAGLSGSGDVKTHTLTAAS